MPRVEEARPFADEQELIGRYQRQPSDAPDGARTVVFGFLSYPQPSPDETGG